MSKKDSIADSTGSKDTIDVILNKTRAKAHFKITSDNDGKEEWIITSKDKNNKEITLALSWDTIQQIEKQRKESNKKD